jgi:hypothetical protein
VRFLIAKDKYREVKNLNKYKIDWDGLSRSKAQFNTKQFLKRYWSSHKVYEEFPVIGSRLKIDILNLTKKIAIEVNGQQHEKFNSFFHDNNRFKFLKGIKNDFHKENFLKLNDINLLIIYDYEVRDLNLKFFEDKFGLII